MYKKVTDTKNPSIAKKNKEKLIILSKCVVCNSRKSAFIKEKEGSRLLSTFRLKIPLSKMSLLGDIISYCIRV